MKLLKYLAIFFFLVATPLFCGESFRCYGRLYSADMEYTAPSSIEEIQEIIRGAKASGKKITIVGAGLSQGKHSLKDDAILIDMKYINQVTVEGQQAIIGGGARWDKVQKIINEHGLSLKVMQGSNIFSVGGSLSANCHGWDFRSSSISNVVSEIKIIDANGQLQTLKKGDQLFKYVIGGYGCFGVIVEATIDLTPNVAIHEHPIHINVDDYVNYFIQEVLPNEKILMHRYRLSVNPENIYKQGIVTNYERAGSEGLISSLENDPRLEHLVKKGSWMIRKFPNTKSLLMSFGKKHIMKDQMTTRNEVMNPPAQFHFVKQKGTADWLQEYFLPANELSRFLKYLGSVLVENKVNVLSTTVRYVKSHDSPLSYAPDKDCFSVVLFFNQSLEKKKIDQTRIWVGQVIDNVIARGGTYYLPYHHFATQEQFQASYPRWHDFQAMKLKEDPTCMFYSGFYDEYFGNSENESSCLRKALEPNSPIKNEVNDFIDNILMNISSKRFSILMERILSDTRLNDDKIYLEMLSRIEEARGNAIGTLKRKLISLISLKKELTSLLKPYLPQKTYSGYVEIGYPGRMVRSLKKIAKIKGPIYIISNYESRIEAGFPYPYSKQFPIHDFAPLTKNLPKDFVDLASCFVGLHHIPEENVHDFVQSIADILRPKGIFILMDHNVDNENMELLAKTIHTIYNASMTIDPEMNKNEIRNFHSKEYWVETLKEHGLELIEHPPLIREGDSTKNELMIFEKIN